MTNTIIWTIAILTLLGVLLALVLFWVARKFRVEEDPRIDEVENVLTVPDTHIILQPSLGIVPLQLFAYYVALQRGCDIDKPRNLAKSVTVE